MRLLLHEDTSWASVTPLRQARLNASSLETVEDAVLKQLASQDRVIHELITRIGPFKLRQEPDPWKTLFSAVIFQQIDGRNAKNIVNRIWRAAGESLDPDDLIFRGQGWLTSFGVTERKERTLLEVAHQIEKGALDLVSISIETDEQILQRLTVIPGVGPWTVSMMLVFHYGRLDVLIPGDLGIRKAIQNQYALPSLPSSPEVMQLGRRWAPYRTIASWYLWKSLTGFPEPGFE